MLAGKSFLQDQYGLKSNPFSHGATYAHEKQDVYEPELYGHQHMEFRDKFFIQPYISGQPIIGALWSSVLRGDPDTRGYGKSTMMGEETKLLNKDFGLTIFKEGGETEQEAAEHPVMAGYVSFDEKNIASIEAAGYHLVKNLVRDGTEAGGSTHPRLRKMLIKQLSQKGKIPKSEESEAIEAALRKMVRQLAIPIDFNGELEKFLAHLCSTDSVGLADYLVGVTNWHHIRTGIKFLQLYTCFAVLAGIKHITYFIDQVEDFTSNSSSTKIMKNVKLIRDALLESEPFASYASFVFQLHPVAWTGLQTAWQHENLRDLGTESRQNEPYVVNLQGLNSIELALKCASTYLNHPKYADPQRPPGTLTPFTEDAIEYAWETTNGITREFLKRMHDLLESGRREKIPVIDGDYAAATLSPAPEVSIVAPSNKRQKRPAGQDSRLA